MKAKKYLFFISQNYSYPVLRPLQEEILKRGDCVKWFLYGSQLDFTLLKKNEISLNNISAVIEYAPDAVFVPGNVVPSFIPGLKIQVFHGLPSTKAKKNGQLYHYIIRGMFDLYCTQGPSSTNKFNVLKEKYQYFSVHETGWCKLDPLFIESTAKQSSYTKRIFFASTFSPRFSKAKVLYPFIVEMIKKYDYNWYITLHPKMDMKVVELYKSIPSNKIIFIESTEVIDYFKKSDIMLCDTSSIIYEYLTQMKPVITFQTQQDEASLINIEHLEDLEMALINTLENIDLNKTNIQSSVRSFHPYQDGNSSIRVLNIVDTMLSGKNLAKKNKPLNLIRNLKLRKELSYWKL